MRNGPRGHAGESGEPASFKGAGLEVFNKAQMMAGAALLRWSIAAQPQLGMQLGPAASQREAEEP
jgi:hypothetical protein